MANMTYENRAWTNSEAIAVVEQRSERVRPRKQTSAGSSVDENTSVGTSLATGCN